MPYYRKKPVIIYAEDITEDTVIETLEGPMQAHAGDKRIFGVKGEQYSCEKSIFAMTYEPVDTTVEPDALRFGTTQQQAILADVIAERMRQDAQWGGPAHDDHHVGWDWLYLMSLQRDALRHALAEGDYNEVRRRFVNLGALALTAIESLQRKQFAPAPEEGEHATECSAAGEGE